MQPEDTNYHYIFIHISYKNLAMHWKPTYKTPPKRNIASTSRISFPNLKRTIFKNVSTFTLRSIRHNRKQLFDKINSFLYLHCQIYLLVVTRVFNFSKKN